MERNQMDMRYQDGRNPYGSEGGYVVSSRGRGRGRGRGRRGDRAMQDYEMDGRVIRSYPNMYQGDYASNMNDMARGGRGGRGRDYGDMARGDSRADYRSYDMRGGDYETRGRDGHHMQGMGGYQPIEAMGYFNGYYGMPEFDYARGGRRDYGSDMRGGDYGRRDYGEDYGYDYGEENERLTEKELEHWCKKLKEQLDEREKQMFSKEMISQKAKQMGKSIDGFSEKELECCVIMLYLDYKKDVGANPDLIIKMAFSFMNDEDSEVRGGEKLALYHDLVMGEL